MPLKEKGASLIVVSRKRDKHPHFIALERFKQTIEKEQSFYNTIFSLIGNQ